MTAYDPSTGTSSTQTVQHVWVNHDHDLLDVTLHEDDGHTTQADASDKTQQVATKAHGSQAPPSPSDASNETIHTTAKHPWLTTDRGWVTAGDLHVGEHVIELDGQTATITALAVRPGAATYYNLTVSNLHTYAVGKSRAVVHNTGPCIGGRPLDQVASDLHSTLQGNVSSQRAIDRTVVAVAEVTTDSGKVLRVVSSSKYNYGRFLEPEANKLGAIFVRGGDHAEMNIMKEAAKNNWTVNALGASIDFCKDMCRPYFTGLPGTVSSNLPGKAFTIWVR